MFRLPPLFRPRPGVPAPVDPRQWAEAFKNTRGDELPAPRPHIDASPKNRDKAFIVGS